MDELTSTEFRKSFQRLTAPTVVTVHGHPIGTWEPVGVQTYARNVVTVNGEVMSERIVPIEDKRFTAQQKRDAILNRVNRGNKP